MKNIFKALSFSILGLGVSSIAQAGVMFSVEAVGVTQSQQAGVTTIDFESGCVYASCDGDFTIGNSFSGGSAPPYIATPSGESYLSVPNPSSNGIADFTLGGDYNYFGLFWGSVDSYNSISFLDDNAIVGSFTGSQITPLLANGGQTSWASNRFVNFSFTDGMVYDTVRLASTAFAFETDNHAYGVPAPGALAFLGLGLAGLGFSRRKLK